jgi:hypothetical protein
MMRVRQGGGVPILPPPSQPRPQTSDVHWRASLTMSTRSRTRSATASSKKATPPESVQAERKPTTRSRKSDTADKENGKEKMTKAPVTSRKSLRSSGPVYCSCQKGDDGSPMILCDECKLWCVLDHNFLNVVKN